MNKKKAIDNLNEFLSIIKNSRTTGFRVKGDRNIFIDTKIEGFDIGYDITGDDNFAIGAEATGPKIDDVIEKYMFILGELQREETDTSRIRQLYEDIKPWAPMIANIILTILRNSNIIT